LGTQSSESFATISNSSITLQKRGSWAPSGTIALYKIGDNLEGLNNIHATQDSKQPQSHAQLASQAIALICEHEAILSNEEMVSIFEIFNKDPVQASSYLTMPKKEWQLVWVQRQLVELGMHERSSATHLNCE